MSENKVYTAIGMMSGTSLDGIDVALVRTDGLDACELLDFRCFPYAPSIREAIRAAFGRKTPDDITAEAARLLTDAHIEAVKDFGYSADVIGFHGQTILHDPANRHSWQIGEPGRLAAQTDIAVVGDMRQNDIQNGGQGAPLLPLCHRAFAALVDKPVAVLNLGGVGNVTWLGTGHHDILAFDTGPANALIDDLVKFHTGETYDTDGHLARKGTADESLLTKWLAHPYFHAPAPKSLDRDEWDVREAYDLGLEDGVATLALFTVRSVARAMPLLPGKPRALYVAGGGRHNCFLMEALNDTLPFPVLPVEELGWNGDGLEAQGFAYLAVRSLKGLALTLPETTGVKEAVSGGVLYTPEDGLRLASAR
jgi:anhydro-N-acetylmuramic acid kinase